MKKMLVCVTVAGLLSAACSVPAVGNDNWRLSFAVYESGWMPVPATFGTDAAALDGLDELDRPASDVMLPEAVFLVSWMPMTGDLIEDVRAPLVPGRTKTWYLQIHSPGSSATNVQVRVWNPEQYDVTGAFSVKILNEAPYPLCTWDPSVNGTEESPAYTFSVPIESRLYLVAGPAPAVPEPGSLIALVCGLIATAGSALRRRI